MSPTALGATASAVNTNHAGILTTRRVQHRPSTRRNGFAWPTQPVQDPDAVARLVANGTLIPQQQQDDPERVVLKRRRATHHNGNGGATLGMRKLTDAQQRAIVAAYTSDPDVRQRDLADEHGVSVVTIVRCLREHGATKARRDPKPRRTTDRSAPTPTLDPQQAQQAAQLYRTGMSREEVADRLGVTEKTIRRALRDLAVPMRRPGRQAVDRDTVAAEYTVGATIPDLAERHRCATATIRRHLAAAGVTMRDDRAGHSGGRNRHPQPVLDAAVRLFTGPEQLTRAQVAERLGIGVKAVSAALHAHGIDPRRNTTTEGTAA